LNHYNKVTIAKGCHKSCKTGNKNMVEDMQEPVYAWKLICENVTIMQQDATSK